MKKNILLLVTGMSPQIVTETVYGLAVKPAPEDRWVPSEIHVISTAHGLNKISGPFLSEDNQLKNLIAEYNLPDIIFNKDCLHVIMDEHNKALNDLRTPEDNECAANVICDLVRKFTENDDVALHVSIAGGRKTMGFYAGYALSLYGRHQDRMSHVLVDEAVDNNKVPSFFYPPKVPTEAPNHSGELVRLDKVEVWLANIPFVRLRSSLNKHAKTDKVSFSEVVRSINDAALPIVIKVNLIEGKTIWINEQTCVLAPREYAFYSWFLTDRVQENHGILRPNKKVFADVSSGFHQFYSGKETCVFDTAFFDERKTEISNIFKHSFGLEIAERITPQQRKRGEPFRVDIDPKNITIMNME